MVGTQNLSKRRLPTSTLIRLGIAILVLAMILVFAVIRWPTARQTMTGQRRSTADARAALANRQYDRAHQYATANLASGSETTQGLEIAAEAAAKAGRIDLALEHYASLVRRQLELKQPPLALFYAAEVCRDSGRLTEAESFYRQFLKYAPNHVLSNERLGFLLNISGRRLESVPHFFSVVRSGKSEVLELVLFADLDRANEGRPFLEDCQRKSPGDRVVRFGLATHFFWEGNTEEALKHLQAITTEFPGFIPGQAMLGELLVSHSDDRFIEWHRQLPAAADSDPGIQFVRGLWARKHNQPQIAARCFWESIRLLPTGRLAMAKLGQQLRILDNPNAAIVERRSLQLAKLTRLIDSVLRTKSKDIQPIRDTAILLEELGRLWEAAAWGLFAEHEFPNERWPRELFARLGDQLTENLPQIIGRENLALQLDLSSFPKFDSLVIESAKSQNQSASPPKAVIRLVELERGPDFTYVNGADLASAGARMFEQSGGGVAVIDYDGDDWPDLFFPQGGIWRTGQLEPDPPTELPDRLFRNSEGQQSIDVTVAAGLVDTGFGQGASVGDFNNDGFPDLYVGNIGRNQLIRNNGDGTFGDVTRIAGLTSMDWTASTAIVDLNADGNPDLFDVNYLTGERVHEMICHEKTCSPKDFPGAPDRLLLSRGDGSFELIAPEKPEVDGKGLGIIAFDLHTRGRPTLFIANDQVPNFLLHNYATGNGHNLRFEDEAFISGVAFNQDGPPMASMGVAADDMDGDGRIDFYITTFKNEPRLLFVQDSPGFFSERSMTAGVSPATNPLIGWGAQCIDPDRDGNPDIILVNGHVDDLRSEGGEYQMRPQFFHNLGSARFEELMGPDAGPFLEQKRVGRGLSRLDWNCDGLMDFAVSNISDPASLVINATQGAGHYISVRLKARHGARDAFGSVIDVRCSDRTWRKQLVAGDGYMASNERVIQFGLGGRDRGQ